MKIPNEVIPDCYKYSKQAFEGKLTADEAAQKIHNLHDVKLGSAKDYPILLKILITGEGSMWNLSSYCQEYFIRKIYEDYGKEQLKKSLNAYMRLIKKYEGDNVGSKKLMRRIYEKYLEFV